MVGGHGSAFGRHAWSLESGIDFYLTAVSSLDTYVVFVVLALEAVHDRLI